MLPPQSLPDPDLRRRDALDEQGSPIFYTLFLFFSPFCPIEMAIRPDRAGDLPSFPATVTLYLLRLSRACRRKCPHGVGAGCRI